MIMIIKGKPESIFKSEVGNDDDVDCVDNGHEDGVVERVVLRGVDLLLQKEEHIDIA